MGDSAPVACVTTCVARLRHIACTCTIQWFVLAADKHPNTIYQNRVQSRQDSIACVDEISTSITSYSDWSGGRKRALSVDGAETGDLREFEDAGRDSDGRDCGWLPVAIR